IPVPVRFVVWVPLGASSVSVSVPLTPPAVDGAKTTVSVQLALGATTEPQLLDASMKPALMAALATCSGRPPLLVSVSVCGGAVRPTPVAGKLSDVGVSDTPGGATPMPVSVT